MSSAHVCVVLALLALLELPMAVDRACTATPTHPSSPAPERQSLSLPHLRPAVDQPDHTKPNPQPAISRARPASAESLVVPSERMVILQAHTRGVLALAAINMESPIICSSSYDGSIKLWTPNIELHTLEPRETLCSGDGAEGAIFSLAARAADDGQFTVCAGSYARHVLAWKCRVGSKSQLLWTSDEHTGWVRALATRRPPSSRAASSLYSIGCNRILGWSLSDQPDRPERRRRDSELCLFEDTACVRSHDILCLAHSDAHERLSCGSVDGAVRVWSTIDSDAYEPLPAARMAHWIGHSDRVPTVAWRGDGRLFTGGYDGYVRSWQMRHTGEEVPPAAGPAEVFGGVPAWRLVAERRVAESGGRVLTLALLGDTDDEEEEVLLCGTSDGDVVALDVEDLSVVERRGGAATKGGRVTALAAVGTRAVVVGDSAGGLSVQSF